MVDLRFWLSSRRFCVGILLGLSGVLGLSSCGGDRAPPPAPKAQATPTSMVFIPGGRGRFGSMRGLPDERPEFERDIADFWLGRTPVTVAAFAQFVAATDFVTTAEREGSGAVMAFGSGRWTLQPGATWTHPLGPEGAAAPADHPVTQVSWDDATAYCGWAGQRLPSELEWEYAARAGHAEAPVYAFGDQLLREGAYLANIWTGIFPLHNTAKDGYALTSPVGAYGLSPIGLSDMAGNVWEWTASAYRPYPPDSAPPKPAEQRVLRGGSFLCDPHVCHGFRVSARMANTRDSSLLHVGFRCAADAGHAHSG